MIYASPHCTQQGGAVDLTCAGKECSTKSGSTAINLLCDQPHRTVNANSMSTASCALLDLCSLELILGCHG